MFKGKIKYCMEEYYLVIVVVGFYFQCQMIDIEIIFVYCYVIMQMKIVFVDSFFGVDEIDKVVVGGVDCWDWCFVWFGVVLSGGIFQCVGVGDK